MRGLIMRNNRLYDFGSSKELMLLTYTYLTKMLREIDLIDCQFESLLALFNKDVLFNLTKEIFLPEYWKIENELNQSQKEDENLSSHFIKSRSRQKRMSFQTILNNNFSLDEIAEDARDFCREYANGSSDISNFLIEIMNHETKEFKIENSNIYKKIEASFYNLGLSKKFIQLIIFNSLTNIVPPFNCLVEEESGKNPLRLIQNLFQLSPSDLIKNTSESSNFVNYGIIEEMNYGRNYSAVDIFLITDRFKEFILNDEAQIFGMDSLQEDNHPTLPLTNFLVSETNKDKVFNLLKSRRPVKILLYGVPGSGKTEFARSIVQEAGLKAFTVYHENQMNYRDRKAALVLGDRLSSENHNCLIFDEADDILNESSSRSFGFFMKQVDVPEQKIWLNELMDQSQGKIIFITNMSSNIHESVLRRFDYSIEFLQADTKQRIYYWNRALEQENLKSEFSEEEIEELAHKYSLGVGGISLALKSCNKIQISNPNSNFKANLNEILSKRVHLLGEKVQKPNLFKTPYDASLLNLDVNLQDLEKTIESYSKSIQSNQNYGQGSLCLLFHGKPGTGKTEYARYLAKKFQLDLLQKRASDLQSPFIGMTERFIAMAFQEAEEKQAIFFLDEADTFFRSRELATRSWETSQTNEFLTWMESFQGIFIASTNLMKDFDSAALRRFVWKCEFKSLKNPDKLRIFAKYFPEVYNQSSFLEREAIKEIQDLTPGDFKTVWGRFRFRDANQLSFDEINNALISEVSYKSQNKEKTVGF